METRKITVINSKTQSQKVIENSTATTLGELKAEMRQLGIDYSGMAFMEGHIRAELKDDASILPTNIPYKGQIVNDLTFLLTAPEKKIKSGAMSRAELIAEAKRLGFPSNPTQAKSSVLQDFIEGKTVKAAPVKEEKKVKKVEKSDAGVDTPVFTEAHCSCDSANVLKIIVEALYSKDILSEVDYTTCMKAVGAKPKKKEKLSEDEIKDMFNFVTRE